MMEILIAVLLGLLGGGVVAGGVILVAENISKSERIKELEKEIEEIRSENIKLREELTELKQWKQLNSHISSELRSKVLILTEELAEVKNANRKHLGEIEKLNRQLGVKIENKNHLSDEVQASRKSLEQQNPVEPRNEKSDKSSVKLINRLGFLGAREMIVNADTGKGWNIPVKKMK